MLNKNIIGGAIGNSIEWYDYAIFGFSAPILSKVLFPHDKNQLTALIGVYLLFAIGFVSRPFGGLILGYIGDKFGRKPMLKLTVMLMSIPTFLIGLTPNYHVLGAFGVYIIAGLRLIQGLAMGGEFTGSVTYLTEIAPKKYESFFGSFAYFTTTFGIFIGSLIIAINSHLFSVAAVHAWAWRIPFLLAIILGIVAYILRSRLDESYKTEANKANPLAETFATNKIVMMKSFGLNFFNAVGFYIFIIFLPTYLYKFIHIPIETTYIISTICTVTLLVTIPIAGRIADIVGRLRLLLVASIILLIFLYPAFLAISSVHMVLTMFIIITITILFGIIQGCLPTTFVRLFKQSARLSSFSISFNVSNAMFGGTAPMVGLYIAKTLGTPHIVIVYPIIALIIFIAIVINISISEKKSNRNKNLR